MELVENDVIYTQDGKLYLVTSEYDEDHRGYSVIELLIDDDRITGYGEEDFFTEIDLVDAEKLTRHLGGN